jgi:hypothetical protein
LGGQFFPTCPERRRDPLKLLYSGYRISLHGLKLLGRDVNNTLSSIYLLTYLLTPRSTVLLEKLTGFQLVKKFPAFYGTRMFITAFTTARQLSLSLASSIQSTAHIPPPEDPTLYYPPIYAWVFQVASFPQVSPKKPCIRLSSPQYALRHSHLVLSLKKE